MNIHKNARLSLARRIEMVQEMTSNGLSARAAASAYGVTAPTVRKWLARYLALGTAGLFDASSRPACSPRAIAPAKALAIVELRHKRLTQAPYCGGIRRLQKHCGTCAGPCRSLASCESAASRAHRAL